MKINNILLAMLGLAVIAPSCSVKELINEGEMPEGAIVRLTFSSDPLVQQQDEATRAMWEDSKGSGNLTFKWENVDIDSDETVKQALIVSDGTNPISVKVPSQESVATFSGLAITPREGDAHYANFQTVGYYATDDLKHAKYCYAVTGAPVITEDANNKRHICQMPDMPATFTQAENQDPSFLKDYMYMYSTTPYSANGNTLTFKHIPATFRFIINNATDKAMPLDEIYMDLSHNTSTNSTTSTEIQDWEDGPTVLSQKAVSDGEIASKSSSVTFNWSDGTSSLSFDGDTYDKVSVSPKTGTTVAAGGKYTAYAMALPLTDKNAFNGKTVNFTIKSNGVEQIAFQLRGSRLAEINGSGIYNWVSGKSYTIRINIGADGQVTGEIILPDKDIVVRSNVNETYTLKYEDANGTPLADYADICTLDVIELDTYRDFINVNIAPREAETIGIYDQQGVRQGTILIDNLKPDYSEEPLYSFGVLSDVHIGRQNDYISAVEDFRRALTFFESKNAALTCICGDITQDGTEAELQQYEQVVLDAGATNVFTTTGNHDCIENSRYGVDPELWQKYTHMPLAFEYSKETNGKTDHFLFLGMSYWNYGAAYLDYHINWLQDKLEAYRNDRCFVITHLFFPGRAGNVNEIYPSGNWLYGLQLEKLTSLCDHYVNTVWFSGHSHWEWAMQGEDNNDQDDESPNIYRTYTGTMPTSGWCVHIPSCGVPSTLNENNERWEVNPGSEGAIVQVYENHIDIIGRDFTNGKYLPIATYRLDTTPQEIAADTTPRENHYLEAADFVPYKGSGMSIKDVEGTDNYIDIIFTDQSQGYYVTNETFYYGVSDAASVTVEDVICWTNWSEETNSGTRVNTIDKVGFYSSQYHLSSTNACWVNFERGVQFQTSSESDETIYPIKIRMKAQMVFSPAFEGGDDSRPVYYLKAENFEKNKYKSNGTFSVTDSQDENYIEVTFNKGSQGFWVKNETFTFGLDYQKVSVIIEDVKAYTQSNGNWSEYPMSDVSKVGFWSGEYNLETTANCYVNYVKGVQFQTSSSINMPEGGLKLKMKVRMQFYASGNNTTPKKHYISAEHFVVNPGKNTGTFEVKNLEDNWVEATFNEDSQGWYIANDTFETQDNGSYTKYVIIKVEGSEIYVNGSKVDSISKLGFRCADTGVYFIGDKEVTGGSEGVEFQSKSDYSESGGKYPVKIKMKAQLFYY